MSQNRHKNFGDPGIFGSERDRKNRALGSVYLLWITAIELAVLNLRIDQCFPRCPGLFGGVEMCRGALIYAAFYLLIWFEKRKELSNILNYTMMRSCG